MKMWDFGSRRCINCITNYAVASNLIHNSTSKQRNKINFIPLLVQISDAIFLRANWQVRTINYRKSSRCSSYVSPKIGLNGLPRRSQFEARALTAKAATYCERGSVYNLNKIASLSTRLNSVSITAGTWSLKIGDCSWDACFSNLAYSMYSATRCRKESGSLKMTGMVILLRSLPSDSTEQRFTSEWPGTGNDVL